MITELIAVAALALAALPAALIVLNLFAYRRPMPASNGRRAASRGRARVGAPGSRSVYGAGANGLQIDDSDGSGMNGEETLEALVPADGRVAPGSAGLVSVLIPARDEEDAIGACIQSVLASRGVELEVVVMDDQSTDRTAHIVRTIAELDPRVRLETAPQLPPGWNGKQRACALLARKARFPILAFLDADVRLAPDGLRRMIDELDRNGADLVSGIPRQVTGTLLERLVVPLIHFVLLGFLPVKAARRSPRPEFGAGCGQLFVTRQASYWVAGGHRAIRQSRHDGIVLPRAYRQAGLVTDLFDATGVAACRMYRSAVDVWQGFAKNADEGMAAPGAIVPWTALLLGGQVLPPLLLLGLWMAGAGGFALAAAAAATALSFGSRALLAVRFRQSALGVLLHPAGVALVVAIQWYAWWTKRAGRSISWKGRTELAGSR